MHGPRSGRQSLKLTVYRSKQITFNSAGSQCSPNRGFSGRQSLKYNSVLYSTGQNTWKLTVHDPSSNKQSLKDNSAQSKSIKK